MNLRLELDLNVEVKLQSQTKLLSTAAILLALVTSSSQSTQSLAGSVADLVDCVTSSILHEVASLADQLAARDILSDAVKWTALGALGLRLLLLLALSLATATLGTHVAAGDGFSIAFLAALATTAAALSSARLLAFLLGFGCLRFLFDVGFGFCLCSAFSFCVVSLVGLSRCRLLLLLLLAQLLGRTLRLFLAGLCAARGVCANVEAALARRGCLLLFLLR